MTTENILTKVAVVLGRFQVPSLTESHHILLNAAKDESDLLVVLLGVPAFHHSNYNPLPFEYREKVISSHFPEAIILPIGDEADNETWVKLLDKNISRMFPAKIYNVTFYGGTDSFFKIYKEYSTRFPLKTPPALLGKEIHGTQVRKEIISQAARNLRKTGFLGHNATDIAWADGVLYGIHHSHNNIPKIVIDALILSNDLKHVLLCRKPHDPPDTWGFVGGFVDATDESMEKAVEREVFEETGLRTVFPVSYGVSCQIKDWRLKGEEKMISSLYFLHAEPGPNNARDDIEETRWFPLEDILENGGDWQRKKVHCVFFKNLGLPTEARANLDAYLQRRRLVDTEVK